MSSTNTLGKYQITREIARSNDVVYEAIDPDLGRQAAVKELCLPPNLTGAQKRERIERFLREGKAAGKLTHPNIVTVYDVGQEGDRFYIAMEYLEGQTLRDVLQTGGAMPVQEAVDIALQLCRALAYAHMHNVVHRDVKPENVQILPGGHVKLTDFGIARIMSEPSITAAGQVFGTPSYMSPEQVSGKQIDGRSDIFSLGVLLYEMLAGHKPFAGDTVVTITYNIMNSEPSPPPGVPPYLVAVISKAMAKDPNLRYQSVDEMAEALRNPNQNGALIYGDPFSASPTSGYSPTYGGPAPTYSPPPASPQPIPDPFSAAPAPYMPLAPPVPRRPILSQETKAFLGALLLVIGLVGMLIFAVWSVTQAYDAYIERSAKEVSMNYIRQGDKLLSEGKSDAAIEQYANAVRSAGSTKAASDARRRLATAYSELARVAWEGTSSDKYSIVIKQAQGAVEADPSYSAGHYYLGEASYHLGNRPVAEDELKKAVDTGGNDEFAIQSRKLLSQLYIENGDALASSGRAKEAIDVYQKAVDLQDPDWAGIASSHMLQVQPSQ